MEIKQLALEQAKEILNDSVVQTVALAARALLNAPGTTRLLAGRYFVE